MPLQGLTCREYHPDISGPDEIDPGPLEHLLLRELDHRIANVLQLAIGSLEFAARRAANDDTQQTIRNAITQLAAHATVNQLLMSVSTGNYMECGVFLTSLAAALQRALQPAQRISIYVEADNVLVAATIGRLLGMLVHELVVNAVKHAFGPSGGHIVIRLSQAGEWIRCSVRDNGLGLRDADPPVRGLGMTLVESLAQRAGAGCTWHVHQDGTEAIITVAAGAPGCVTARPA